MYTRYISLYKTFTIYNILNKINEGSPNVFPHMLIIGSVPWRKPGKIFKNGFLPLLRESKMKRFQSKIWHLKFSFSSFAKFAIFAKISKNHVLSFLLMSGLCVITGT